MGGAGESVGVGGELRRLVRHADRAQPSREIGSGGGKGWWMSSHV